MTHTYKIFRMKNLVVVMILISISLIAKSYWVNSQKIQGKNNFHINTSTLESDVKNTSNEIDVLKTGIQKNRESLAKLSHDIGTQFAELQDFISKSETSDNYDKNDEELYGMTEKDGEEKINAETNEQIGLMETTLKDKESDPKWSMEAKQSIYEAFSVDKLEGINLNNAVCGSTLCRVNLSLDGTKEAGETYRDIIEQAPWSGQGFVKIDEEAGEVDFYLAKEGHKLPKIEEEENVL